MQGTKWSAEQNAKRSAAFKGEKNPMYGKIGSLNPMYGRKHSEESKQKMRATKLKNRKKSI